MGQYQYVSVTETTVTVTVTVTGIITNSVVARVYV